jgi:hypothetical protein
MATKNNKDRTTYLTFKDKCKFFKDWLFDFISSQIMIERIWYIDLSPKIEVVSNKNISRKNKTRKSNNVKQS